MPQPAPRTAALCTSSRIRKALPWVIAPVALVAVGAGLYRLYLSRARAGVRRIPSDVFIPASLISRLVPEL